MARRDVLDLGLVAGHRSLDLGADLEAVLDQELDHPNHPARVIREGLVRVRGTPHPPLVQVLAPTSCQVKNLRLIRAVGQVMQSPQQCVERELPAINVLFDGGGLYLLRLVAALFVLFQAGCGDLDVLTLEVLAIHKPVAHHFDQSDLVGGVLPVRLCRDGLEDFLPEPLRVPAFAQGHRVDHHVDVLDGLIENEVANRPSHHINVLGDTKPLGHPGQKLDQGHRLLMGTLSQMLAGNALRQRATELEAVQLREPPNLNGVETPLSGWHIPLVGGVQAVQVAQGGVGGVD